MSARQVTYNLAGSVRNMSLPVAGTTIVLYDYWTSAAGLQRHYVTEHVTGTKGDFAFDVRKGVYSIEVIPNRDTRFARQTVDAIKVTRNTTFSVSLKTGAIFSGQVRTASGAAVSSCELLFFGIEPEALRTVEAADAAGQFSVALAAGRYAVFCRQSSEGKKATPFLAPSSRVLDIDADEKTEFVLPELVRFSGSVTNTEGHPVAGVKAIITASATADGVFDREAALKCICFSDKKGQFYCDVEAGTYDIKLEPGPDSHLSERQFASIVVDQARTKAYPLGHGYSLYGNITYQGEPVQDALVTVYGGKIDSSTLTDSEGNYAFSLSGGSYEISVMSQPDSLARFPYRAPAPNSVSISLAEDTEKDVPLEEGVLLDGKIVDPDGKPRSGVHIALYKSSPAASNGAIGRPIAYGITGDDGSYEFRVLEGRYSLVINNQKATAISVEANGNQKAAELTWSGACLVDFEVVSELDEPISNCQIVCEPYSGTQQQTEPIAAVTDESGSGQLTLPAGIYSFRIEPPAQGSFEAKSIRQLSVNTDVRKKVKLGFKS